MRDDKLIQKLHTDPENGMKTLIDAYAGLVYAVVRGKLSSLTFGPDEAAVEDCVADTFSEFYCGFDKYDPSKGSIKSYLCVIAKHNAVDYIRRSGRDTNTVSLDDSSAEQYADDFSLEGDFEDACQRRELLEAVKSLGHTDREILLRKYYLSQSSKEIADIMHMTVSGVDTRAHRAIRKLRRKLGGNC